MIKVIGRAVGWVFVAAIAYHAVRAWGQTARAVSEHNWGYAAELGAIALVATMVVLAAALQVVANSVRGHR